MKRSSSRPGASAARSPLRLGVLACALVAASLTQLPGVVAAAGAAPGGSSMARPSASVALVQCVTAVDQTERSVTFAGEMTAVAGSARLEMRIELLERMPQEVAFRTVIAPGLGVWRFSAPGVKVYKYLKQVTNLSAPAFYRGAVRFRWLNSKGRLIKALELRTPRCLQPAPPATALPPAGAPM